MNEWANNQAECVLWTFCLGSRGISSGDRFEREGRASVVSKSESQGIWSQVFSI